MSLPNIPDITPKIDLCIKDSLKLSLNSIAMQEMGLSHLLNTESEKIELTMKEIEKCGNCNREDIKMLLEVNKSVENTVKLILRSQMILQMKFQEVKDFYEEILKEEKNHKIINDCNEEEICEITNSCKEWDNTDFCKDEERNLSYKKLNQLEIDENKESENDYIYLKEKKRESDIKKDIDRILEKNGLINIEEEDRIEEIECPIIWRKND